MTTFNMNKFRLEDVEFFTDERLDKINVYSVTLVCLDPLFESIVCDFMQRMKHYSCVQMIQQMAGDFCRFTFVSHVACKSFSGLLQMEIDKLSKIYKCNLSLL